MLAVGFVAGRPQAAIADDAPQAVAVASADGAVDRARNREASSATIWSKNPELLLEMQQALETKQREEQRVANLEVIKDAKDEIFNAAYDGVVGNPDGKTTIVEFYDYNCGFCKRAQEDMLALTAADPDLRFVLKEFPILGPDSQKAHVVSMAFRALMPEKYGDFHNQLLGGQGRASEATRDQDRAVARRRRGEAARGNEEPGHQRRPSRRPTNSPTSWRSPARRPMSSATRSCSARSARKCWPRRSPRPAACADAALLDPAGHRTAKPACGQQNEASCALFAAD